MTAFEKPSVTADVVIVNDSGEILLIKRGRPPFEGSWALPGGFIEYGKETIEQCAIREAKEETGLDVKLAVLLGVRSRPDRDPRGHTVTAVYLCEKLGSGQAEKARADDDASDVLWLAPTRKNIEELGLAFDHQEIIEDAIERGFIGEQP